MEVSLREVPFDDVFTIVFDGIGIIHYSIDGIEVGTVHILEEDVSVIQTGGFTTVRKDGNEIVFTPRESGEHKIMYSLIKL